MGTWCQLSEALALQAAAALRGICPQTVVSALPDYVAPV
jgi:hypothetical protein